MHTPTIATETRIASFFASSCLSEKALLYCPMKYWNTVTRRSEQKSGKASVDYAVWLYRCGYSTALIDEPSLLLDGMKNSSFGAIFLHRNIYILFEPRLFCTCNLIVFRICDFFCSGCFSILVTHLEITVLKPSKVFHKHFPPACWPYQADISSAVLFHWIERHLHCPFSV